MNYYNINKLKRQKAQRRKAIKQCFNTLVNRWLLPIAGVIIAYIVLLIIAI